MVRSKQRVCPEEREQYTLTSNDENLCFILPADCVDCLTSLDAVLDDVLSVRLENFDVRWAVSRDVCGASLLIIPFSLDVPGL